MFRTLACLAAAMSGTSILLGWIDPSSVPPLPQRPFDSVLREVRSRIRTNDLRLVPLDDWRSLAVLADSTGLVGGIFLTAAYQDPPYHFRIEPDGQLFRTAAWNAQKRFRSDPDEVRVMLSRKHRDDPMTRAQWRTIQAMAISLGGDSPPASSLPVRLDDDWAKLYGVSTAIAPGPLHPGSS